MDLSKVSKYQIRKGIQNSEEMRKHPIIQSKCHIQETETEKSQLQT